MMWLQEPDDTTPDLLAEGGWKCETCGYQWGNVNSTWPNVSLRVLCFCGTEVEIVPARQSDGPESGQECLRPG